MLATLHDLCKCSSSGGGRGGTLARGGSPGEPDGDGPPEIIQRHTELAFHVEDKAPDKGVLSFSLKVKPSSPTSRKVDIHVPADQTYAMILVHASSTTFLVGPEIRKIKISREDDSETATFAVRAQSEGEGSVNLLVYDQFQLIGSLEVELKAVSGQNGLELKYAGKEIFRDPATAELGESKGVFVQVSINPGQQIEYHALRPNKIDRVWHPELFSLGQSPEPFDSAPIQSALMTIRRDVDGLERILGSPPDKLNDSTRHEALGTLRIKLRGIGQQIATELLSANVRTLLASRRKGSVIHLTISNRQLDGIPWELAVDPDSGDPLTQQMVLVRVPVRNGQVIGSSVNKTTTETPIGGAAPKNRFVYVLGRGVVSTDNLTAAQHALFQDVVQSASHKGYSVISNFNTGQRLPIGLKTLSEWIKDAKVVHLLCHGVIEEKTNQYYLEIDKDLGILRPSDVGGFALNPGAVVFINACSSASATFGVTGLTTFGWEFRKAGAAVYIGTLAPVTTDLAIRFAKAFFDAYVGENAELSKALFKARQAVAGNDDPTWMLYSVYGDLHAEEQKPSQQGE